MSVQELYSKNARVWVPDPEEVWVGGVLQEDYTGQKSELRILRDDGQEVVHKLINKKAPAGKKDAHELPPLRNPDILIGQNDLTSMSYLNEPEVLYNLQVRFCDRHEIYTYCGIVLVAINPYEELSIYGNELIHAYSGQDMGSMDPHIFAVAEEAYKKMARFDENQSVIVSGESGAGKTVSAKYTMRYFATVGGAESETQVERRVLASNPVMEAIGNAKTTRNDNSSRFGKYLEIRFAGRANRIVGASMRTYLLEKSRVVYQSPGERNYHIFYQMCASREASEMSGFSLDHQDAFFYTCQGDSPEIDRVDDEHDFGVTREAMSLLGIPEASQLAVFQILSGILHMGNIQFTPGDRNDSVSVSKTDPHLAHMCRLWGCDSEQMRTWLCNRTIATVHETLNKPLTHPEAVNARDALAKFVYSKVFDWLVTQINHSIGQQNPASGQAQTKDRTSSTHKFIGVLDIYGFETFEVNSFEQFCINYANEKLQQQFNMHVFKLEQDEYVKEEIEWSFIDFYDNQPCIDLIEMKMGILDLLDEECKMPKGSDANWCQKLYQKFVGKNEHFIKPKMSNENFIVVHFADKVDYYINGFLEKNRDTVLEDQVNLLKASDVEFFADLFHEATEGAKPASRTTTPQFKMNITQRQPKASNKQNKKTVGTQFSESLRQLMTTLNSTTPHYIRCIKPNDLKLPFSFCSQRAVQQLRACGVLETVRISAAGFPSRWGYPEFFNRYRLLVPSKQLVRNNTRETCKNILTTLISDEDKYRFGKTKLFFRAGQVAYLEKLRGDRLRWAGVTIQRHVRGWLVRRRCAKMRRSLLLVQTYARGLLARRKATTIRRRRAAIKIQTWYRGHSQRHRYKVQRRSAITIQCAWRSYMARILRQTLHYQGHVVKCQSIVRGFLARRRYKKIVRGIVLIQSHFRRRRAKRELQALKVEARSLNHIKTVNKGLENKIIELQQRLDGKTKELVVVKEGEGKLVKLQEEVMKLKKCEEEVKTTGNRVQDLEGEVARLKRELGREKAEKDALVTEKEKMKMEHVETITALQEQKLNLEALVEKYEKEKMEKDQSMEKMQQAQVSLTRTDEEFSAERAHHQQLVRNYNRLQQKYENLCRDFAFATTGGGGSGSGGKYKGRRRSSAAQGGDAQDADGEDDEGSLGDLDEETESEAATDDDRQSDSTPEHRFRSRSELQVSKPERDNVFLLLALQKKADMLHNENTRLKDQLERSSERPHPAAPSISSMLQETPRGTAEGQESVKRSSQEEQEVSYYSEKNQELSIQVSRLRKQLDIMNKATAEGTGQNALLNQLEALRAELDNRREECVRLNSILKSKSKTMIADDFYGGNSGLINEDGELEMAYETQKEINRPRVRKLQLELDNTIKDSHNLEGDYKKVVVELQKEVERQQKLIGQLGDVLGNMSLTSQEKLDSCMQQEITRLTAENIDLREANSKCDASIRTLKRAVKFYARKLQKYEGSLVPDPNHHDALMDTVENSIAQMEDGTTSRRDFEECQGLVNYKKDDETLLIRNLVFDMEPRIAVSLLPGLPAYILFMAVRQADVANDDEKVRSLLTNTINAIRKACKKRQKQLDYLCLWLANSSRLLHCMKQYSGEASFQTENSPRQNDQCLKNFDLSEFRQILNDLNVWIYQVIIKHCQDDLVTPHVLIAGVLEHEGITGLGGAATGGAPKRVPGADAGAEAPNNLDALVKVISNIYRALSAYAVDPEVINQIFCQLFYWLCAHCLNNLLLRKELCHWAKGMQIRYNLSHLENWLRDNNLTKSGAAEWLDPLVQASQLLQANKTDGNVDTICEMCSKLTISQIVKLLNLYTPVDGYEERVPVAFIRLLQERLKAVRSSAPPPDPPGTLTAPQPAGLAQTLMVNTKNNFPVRFPFHPSSVAMETVRIPDTLNLGFLQRS